MAPTTFPAIKQFAGVALEATQGTAVAMASTVPVTKLVWEDKPKWLDDKAWRNWMTTVAGRQVGPLINEFSVDGPVFGDTFGFVLANMFGDLVGTGTTTTPTTTLSVTVATPTAASPVTSIQTAASIPAGTTIQIDTGNAAEIRKTGTPSGAGPYTIPFAAGERSLIYGHTSGVQVTAVIAPFTNVFSLLNSQLAAVYAQGQPPTHTWTHYQGVTATVGARVFPGSCCSELTIKFNAESELLVYSAKFTSWPSAAASAMPTSAPSSVQPIAPWRGALGVGGPASGGTKVLTVRDGEVTFKRKLQPIWTMQGVQTPYTIQRGELEASGKLTFVAADETPYTNLINNVQPQYQFLIANGLAGANAISLQVDAQNGAYRDSKMEGGKVAIEYGVDWDGIANTTNAGGSGGGSPCKVTLANATPANTYQ